MSEHHARVAPRAEDPRSSHGAGGLRKRSVAERSKSVGDGPKCQAEIGAGVPVGDWKDVDPVDLIASRSHPVRRRVDRARQTWAIHVGDADRHGR
jgi:hypothetical protein